MRDRISKVRLTSRPSLEEAIGFASLGSNKIIEKIGKDRSHISKAIQFLKKNELLEEHGKWQKGKTKDTRLTKAGVYIAILNSCLSNYENQYLHFQEKILKHYYIPKNLSQDDKETQLSRLGWETDTIPSFEISLSCGASSG